MLPEVSGAFLKCEAAPNEGQHRSQILKCQNQFSIGGVSGERLFRMEDVVAGT